jgi:hypothetical protein
VEPASPLVAKIAPVADLGDCDQIVFGGGNSNAVAAIKFGQNEESVQFFSGNPLVKKGEAKFDVEKNLKQQYFLSSNGAVMARMTSFPKLGVQLWDTNTNQEIKIVPLEDKALPAGAAGGNVPEMVGFGFEDRLVVLWPGMHPRFEVINSKVANAPRIIFQVADFDRTPSNPVISPDGRQVALEAVFQGEAGVDLWDLTAARREPLHTCKPLRNDLKQPLGLAYGPMGMVAAYFEVAGKGIMYSFRASDGKPLHDENGFPYRTLPYPPGAAETFTGRGLDYVDPNTWLLMGRSLIDTETGKILGDLKVDNAKAQRVVDKETVLIESQTPDGKMQLLQVKLKADQISARRVEARKKGP